MADDDSPPARRRSARVEGRYVAIGLSVVVISLAIVTLAIHLSGRDAHRRAIEAVRDAPDAPR